jgi:hypothetical protein
MLQKTNALVAKTAPACGSPGLRPVARRRAFAAAPLAVALILAAPNVEATPQFARQTGQRCSFCHSGVPRLNDTGLTFKNDGFRFPNSTDAPDKDHKDAPAQ